MVAVAHISKITRLFSRQLYAALLPLVLALVVACGSSSDGEAAEPVSGETVRLELPTAVTERSDIATVAPATAVPDPTEPVAQTPTETPARSVTSTPIPANPTATSVSATGVATTAPSEAVVATVTAARSTQAVTPAATATSTPPTAVSDDSVQTAVPERDFDVITLLPPDAIPALNNPGYHDTTEDADESYDDDDLVLGIEINGDARAFSVPLLSRHEIVNDTIGGEPVAVTW